MRVIIEHLDKKERSNVSNIRPRWPSVCSECES